MTLARTVLPETLDGLAEEDPRAIRSRRDLRRVNAVMGAPRIVAKGLRQALGERTPGSRVRILEIGAGDGSLMLAVARRLGDARPAVDLVLLDRQRLVDDATVAAFRALGWTATSLQVDLLDWIAEPPAERFDAIVANLFLHHFDAATLPTVLAAIAARCDGFFACEPRRAPLPLAGSHLIGALAVNAVTREDAVLSVHAGFCGRELTAAWPVDGERWTIREASAGLFSHCFGARRAGR